MLQRLLDARPGDLEVKGNFADCERMMGRALARRDPARARQHALKAAQLDSDRVAAEPHNAEFKLDLSRDFEQLGNSHTRKGQFEEAQRYYQQAQSLLRQAWDGDRANMLARDQLAAVFRMGETHVRAGQHRQADPVLRESIQLMAARPDQTPGSVKGNLARAYLSLGAVESAAKRSPCRSYRRMEELLRELPNPDRLFPPETAELRERARERLKSCPA